MTNLKDELIKLASIQNIKLEPLERTVVNTKTQEEFNELLRVYERGGWRCGGGALSISCLEKFWNDYKEETCVSAGVDYRFEQKGRFGYGIKSFYLKKNWNVISIQEFYEMQKITSDKLNEINNLGGK